MSTSVVPFIEGLRRRRIDVSTASEAALLAATYVKHNSTMHIVAEGSSLHRTLTFCVCTLRAIGHSGIAFFRLRRTTGNILQMLILLFDVLTAEEMVGRVEFLRTTAWLD